MKRHGFFFTALITFSFACLVGCSDTGLEPESQTEEQLALEDSEALVGSAARSWGVGRVRGSFLIATDDGLVAMSPRGDTFLFGSDPAPFRNIEVQGTRIFASGWSRITEYDLSGAVVSTIILPERIGYPIGFTALPDGDFAILDCLADSVYFVDETGIPHHAVEMPETSHPENLQNMMGLVRGGKLIISETGTGKIAAIDLTTYDATIFRDFSSEFGWFADINFKRPFYYVTRSQKLQRFTRRGRLRDVAEFEGYNLTGIAIFGNHAFGVLNHVGEVHRIHLASGRTRLLAEGLNTPRDIEFIPVVLTPPVGP